MKVLEALTTENINKLDMIDLGILAEKFAVFVDAVADDISQRRAELLSDKRQRKRLQEKCAALPRPILIHDDVVDDSTFNLERVVNDIVRGDEPLEHSDRYKPRLFHYGQSN
jgi:hypothetical protein